MCVYFIGRKSTEKIADVSAETGKSHPKTGICLNFAVHTAGRHPGCHAYTLYIIYMTYDYQDIRMEPCRDYEGMTRVWLAAVRATHHFLSEEDIDFYHKRLPDLYMPHVDLYAIRNARGECRAFIGLSQEMVEMLFVHPDDMGKGYGSMLLRFACRGRGIRRVDVNEQNERALGFYLHHGFSITGRDATDSEGKPYPILHLSM